MKNIYVIIFFFSCISIFSQKKQFDLYKEYPVNEILKDIDYTEKYLSKFHPDPFKYISKDSLHAFVLQVKSKIDTPLTEMQIRFYIKQIISKIGCGHTDAGASKTYAKVIQKTNRPVLPLNTFVIDTNKLFVLNNLSLDSSIEAGDEIISINNKPIKEILKVIYSVYSADGYNQTYKKQGIKYEWFKYYYSFCYGYKPSYKVQIKNDSGVISTHTIASISSLKDTLLLPKKDSINYIHKTKTCSYSILKSDTNIAIIDINAFKGKHWRRFFRRSFKDIKQRSIQNLVIDLRDNGGGQVSKGLNFLTYLVDKSITLPFDRRPNLMAFNPRFKMDVFSRLTPLIFTLMMPELPKNGRLRHYFIAFPKHKKAYKKNIYVLINGKSFSMSGVASSYLKYKANAVIIGEETGGNIAGSNAIISGRILLPNSKIRIFTPMYHIYHRVNVTNNNHGLMPDYPTFYSKEDILNGVDVDLNKVMELVK